MSEAANVSTVQTVQTLPRQYAALVEQLASLEPVSWERGHLVEAALEIWRRPGFDTLASLSQLRFDPFDYQLRAAAVALQQMAGRATLADEVGLGKTIEAGIIMSELRLRGLPAGCSSSLRRNWSGSGAKSSSRLIQDPSRVRLPPDRAQETGQAARLCTHRRAGRPGHHCSVEPP